VLVGQGLGWTRNRPTRRANGGQKENLMNTISVSINSRLSKEGLFGERIRLFTQEEFEALSVLPKVERIRAFDTGRYPQFVPGSAKVSWSEYYGVRTETRDALVYVPDGQVVASMDLGVIRLVSPPKDFS